MTKSMRVSYFQSASSNSILIRGLLVILLISGAPLPLRAGLHPAGQDATDPEFAKAKADKREAIELLKKQTPETRAQALEKYRSARAIFQKLGNKDEEAECLNGMGSIFEAMGELRSALEQYREALRLRTETGDRKGIGVALNNMAIILQALGDQKSSREAFEQSLAIRREVGDRQGEARVLNNLASLLIVLNEFDTAKTMFESSLAIRREVKDRQGEAATLLGLGNLYTDWGERRRAIQYLEEALKISREVGNRMREGDILGGLGSAYSALGEKQTAFEYHQQALALRRTVGDRTGEATSLGNLGSVSLALGESQKALDYFLEALALHRQSGRKRNEAVMLNNIGNLFLDLGEAEKAVTYFEQSLAIRREIADRRGEATTLNNLGSLYFDIGQIDRAIDLHQKALAINQAINARDNEASVQHNLARNLNAVGERQRAIELYEQAIARRREIGERVGLAASLRDLGQVYSSSGNPAKARECFDEALTVVRATGVKSDEAATLIAIASHERRLGNLETARSLAEQAVLLGENLRAKLESHELRASYAARIQRFYDEYLRILADLHAAHPEAGHAATAFAVSERARARTLLDLLAETSLELREGVDPKLIAREREIFDSLTIKRARLQKAFAAKTPPANLEQLEREVNELDTTLDKIQREIRTSSPRYTALTRGNTISLAETRAVLDADTALIEYRFTEDAGFAWVVTTEGVVLRRLTEQKDIEELARKAYEQLTARNRRQKFESADERQARFAQADAQATQLLGTLSSYVISPLEPALAKKKKILVVPDGALSYLPFGVLQVAGTKKGATVPLIERFEVTVLPSASALAALRKEYAGRKPAPKPVAILADPVFSSSDERLLNARQPAPAATTRAVPGSETDDVTRAVRGCIPGDESTEILRLPYSRREAETIRSVVGNDCFLALDFKADLGTAVSPELSKYRIVHFATHGFLNSRNPELSGLIFSLVDEGAKPKNGFLRLHDVFGMKLPAQLVVLSGCRTGLGKEIRGEGLVGLTRGFMYAGAERVMVSLWDVNDEATAELMARFYKHHLGPEKLSPSAALRAAQLELSREKKFGSPYYWAAFTLQGEPK